MQQSSNYVESTIGTKVEIGGLYLSWPNGVSVKNIYLEDQQADTLLYAEHLYAGISYLSLIQGKIKISSVELENAVANIQVAEQDSSFNFEYIITAFAPADTLAVDTTIAADSTAMDIDIGSIEIINTRFNYHDKAAGMKMSYHIGRLYARTEEFDVNKNIYYADQVELENSSGNIQILKSSPPDTSSTGLPEMKVGADHLLVNNTQIRFSSKPDKMNLFADDLFGKSLPV